MGPRGGLDSRKISSPPEFDPRTVQPVAQSLYRLSYPAHCIGPEGSRNLRFPDFMTTAQDGGKVVSLMHRPPLPPGNAPGTHFCYRAIQMKN